MTVRHLKVADNEVQEATHPGSVRIAFATGDRHTVDQHFGLASGFAIYQVGCSGTRLLEVAAIEEPADAAPDCDRLTPRLEVVDGCAALYCNAIGAPAVRRLLAQQCQPRKVPPGTAIDAVIGRLIAQLRERPPAWLGRALRGDPPGEERFDAMEATGWRAD
ncbi:NifB/NifX family molybdenum-iron cluster-binding protein [Halorhodospira halophila]|uniref:Dinitrogenase iron-molybdenum cofactor biosynthesis n=1 Tax=Halorhodospira halophila (strain DSM 244 / SL1) TaxID=349124 RepID=A1WTP7_HALHL|nr:NifB/NifX family molybdenum-iron cluster-binding protein [Halorhodospira halophila]ABM61059.1 Dinitrogenase iron-molybdenum cofactor biosynthesis [Halorhodospira halophila SL1]MBK1729776.1 hypothetical protein [Halorhodospira halophila]